MGSIVRTRAFRMGFFLRNAREPRVYAPSAIIGRRLGAHPFNAVYKAWQRCLFLIAELGTKFHVRIRFYQAYLLLSYRKVLRYRRYENLLFEYFAYLFYGSLMDKYFFSPFYGGCFPIGFFRRILWTGNFYKYSYSFREHSFAYNLLRFRTTDLTEDVDIYISSFFSRWSLKFPEGTTYTSTYKYRSIQFYYGLPGNYFSVFIRSFGSGSPDRKDYVGIYYTSLFFRKFVEGLRRSFLSYIFSYLNNGSTFRFESYFFAEHHIIIKSIFRLIFFTKIFLLRFFFFFGLFFFLQAKLLLLEIFLFICKILHIDVFSLRNEVMLEHFFFLIFSKIPLNSLLLFDRFRFHNLSCILEKNEVSLPKDVSLNEPNCNFFGKFFAGIYKLNAFKLKFFFRSRWAKLLKPFSKRRLYKKFRKPLKHRVMRLFKRNSVGAGEPSYGIRSKASFRKFLFSQRRKLARIRRFLRRSYGRKGHINLWARPSGDSAERRKMYLKLRFSKFFKRLPFLKRRFLKIFFKKAGVSPITTGGRLKRGRWWRDTRPEREGSTGALSPKPGEDSTLKFFGWTAQKLLQGYRLWKGAKPSIKLKVGFKRSKSPWFSRRKRKLIFRGYHLWRRFGGNFWRQFFSRRLFHLRKPFGLRRVNFLRFFAIGDFFYGKPLPKLPTFRYRSKKISYKFSSESEDDEDVEAWSWKHNMFYRIPFTAWGHKLKVRFNRFLKQLFFSKRKHLPRKFLYSGSKRRQRRPYGNFLKSVVWKGPSRKMRRLFRIFTKFFGRRRPRRKRVGGRWARFSKRKGKYLSVQRRPHLKRYYLPRRMHRFTRNRWRRRRWKKWKYLARILCRRALRDSTGRLKRRHRLFLARAARHRASSLLAFKRRGRLKYRRRHRRRRRRLYGNLAHFVAWRKRWRIYKHLGDPIDRRRVQKLRYLVAKKKFSWFSRRRRKWFHRGRFSRKIIIGRRALRKLLSKKAHFWRLPFGRSYFFPLAKALKFPFKKYFDKWTHQKNVKEWKFLRPYAYYSSIWSRLRGQSSRIWFLKSRKDNLLNVILSRNRRGAFRYFGGGRKRRINFRWHRNLKYDLGRKFGRHMRRFLRRYKAWRIIRLYYRKAMKKRRTYLRRGTLRFRKFYSPVKRKGKLFANFARRNFFGKAFTRGFVRKRNRKFKWFGGRLIRFQSRRRLRLRYRARRARGRRQGFVMPKAKAIKQFLKFRGRKFSFWKFRKLRGSFFKQRLGKQFLKARLFTNRDRLGKFFSKVPFPIKQRNTLGVRLLYFNLLSSIIPLYFPRAMFFNHFKSPQDFMHLALDSAILNKKISLWRNTRAKKNLIWKRARVDYEKDRYTKIEKLKDVFTLRSLFYNLPVPKIFKQLALKALVNKVHPGPIYFFWRKIGKYWGEPTVNVSKFSSKRNVFIQKFNRLLKATRRRWRKLVKTLSRKPKRQKAKPQETAPVEPLALGTASRYIFLDRKSILFLFVFLGLVTRFKIFNRELLFRKSQVHSVPFKRSYFKRLYSFLCLWRRVNVLCPEQDSSVGLQLKLKRRLLLFRVGPQWLFFKKAFLEKKAFDFGKSWLSFLNFHFFFRCAPCLSEDFFIQSSLLADFSIDRAKPKGQASLVAGGAIEFFRSFRRRFFLDFLRRCLFAHKSKLNTLLERFNCLSTQISSRFVEPEVQLDKERFLTRVKLLLEKSLKNVRLWLAFRRYFFFSRFWLVYMAKGNKLLNMSIFSQFFIKSLFFHAYRFRFFFNVVITKGLKGRYLPFFSDILNQLWSTFFFRFFFLFFFCKASFFSLRVLFFYLAGYQRTPWFLKILKHHFNKFFYNEHGLNAGPGTSIYSLKNDVLPARLVSYLPVSLSTLPKNLRAKGKSFSNLGVSRLSGLFRKHYNFLSFADKYIFFSKNHELSLVGSKKKVPRVIRGFFTRLRKIIRGIVLLKKRRKIFFTNRVYRRTFLTAEQRLRTRQFLNSWENSAGVHFKAYRLRNSVYNASLKYISFFFAKRFFQFRWDLKGNFFRRRLKFKYAIPNRYFIGKSVFLGQTLVSCLYNNLGTRRLRYAYLRKIIQFPSLKLRIFRRIRRFSAMRKKIIKAFQTNMGHVFRKKFAGCRHEKFFGGNAAQREFMENYSKRVFGDSDQQQIFMEKYTSRKTREGIRQRKFVQRLFNRLLRRYKIPLNYTLEKVEGTRLWRIVLKPKGELSEDSPESQRAERAKVENGPRRGPAAKEGGTSRSRPVYTSKEGSGPVGRPPSGGKRKKSRHADLYIIPKPGFYKSMWEYPRDPVEFRKAIHRDSKLEILENEPRSWYDSRPKRKKVYETWFLWLALAAGERKRLAEEKLRTESALSKDSLESHKVESPKVEVELSAAEQEAQREVREWVRETQAAFEKGMSIAEFRAWMRKCVDREARRHEESIRRGLDIILPWKIATAKWERSLKRMEAAAGGEDTVSRVTLRIIKEKKKREIKVGSDRWRFYFPTTFNELKARREELNAPLIKGTSKEWYGDLIKYLRTPKKERLKAWRKRRVRK